MTRVWGVWNAGAPGTEKEGRSASAPLPATVAPDTELQDMSKVQKPAQGPAATMLAARPPQVSVSPSMPVMHAQEADEVRQDFMPPRLLYCALVSSDIPIEGRLAVDLFCLIVTESDIGSLVTCLWAQEKGDGAQPPQVEDDGDLRDDRSCPGSPTTPAHVPIQNMRGVPTALLPPPHPYGTIFLA